MSKNRIINMVFGSSPLLHGVRKVHSHLFFRGGSSEVCYEDSQFFEILSETIDGEPKCRRASPKEIRDLFSEQAKLTKDQRLVKSIMEEIEAARRISDKDFKNLKDLYEVRRKFRNYLRIKRFIPLTILAPFTNSELSKMAYPAALGSKSVGVTLPGLIGYSLPAFFFFHMSSFYVPDKIKPVCQICKYTLGGPVWIVSYITDELLSSPEEKFFGDPVPIDITATGGTIPKDLGDISQLQEVLEDMRDFGKNVGKDFTQKSYN